MKYDIIGDIHGHADELEALLTRLGYRKDGNGVYQTSEPNRQVIFIGDFIDRGPDQFRSVAIARDMVEAGRAQAIMGNHEFNAGMYHTHMEQGGEMVPLRPHDEKNNHQHQAFLDALNADPAQGRKNIEWLKSLPLFLELDGLRVVHALWDEEGIQLLKNGGILDEKNRIKPDQWVNLVDYKAPLGRAAEHLTKGLEIDLPDGVAFNDADGIERRKGRLKWWANYQDPAITLDKVILDVPAGAIPAIPLSAEIKAAMQEAQRGEGMTFFGHYWQKGEFPTQESAHAICIDQSVAKDGHLVAATATVEHGNIGSIEYTSVKSYPDKSMAPAKKAGKGV